MIVVKKQCFYKMDTEFCFAITLDYIFKMLQPLAINTCLIVKMWLPEFLWFRHGR